MLQPTNHSTTLIGRTDDLRSALRNLTPTDVTSDEAFSYGFLSSAVQQIVNCTLQTCTRAGKVRLFVRVRIQGCRIESVPLKRLLELSGFRKRRWESRDGWLILEAF
jgi:hypothetical protein